MDKNQVIGFILIFALILGYTYYSAPTEEELEARKEELRKQEMEKNGDTIAVDQIKDTTLVVENNVATNTGGDSLADVRNQAIYGDFATAVSGNEEVVTLENDDLKLSISSKGGRIIAAELKKHYYNVNRTDKNSELANVVLLNNPKNKFEYFLPAANLPSGGIPTTALNFTPSKSGNTVTMTAQTGSGGSFSQTYTIGDSGYNVDYSVALKGMQGSLNTNEPIKLYWDDYLNKLEKGVAFEQRYSTVYFKEADESNADYCSCTSSDVENLPDQPIEWVAHANQFFNTSLMTEGRPFAGAELETQVVKPDEADYLKIEKSTITLPITGGNDQFDMSMYIGPNEFDNLLAYDNSLEQIIPFGNSLFGTINRWVIRPFFNFLSKFISSKGLVIITLIFLVKMLLYPLMYKMLHSQALMGALKPQLAHLNEKFADDPQKKQMETMKIYREHGVSPFGGCLPMIVQMPIWYAMFRFFPASITFRQEPFLWAHDLSSYDDFFHLPFNVPFIGDHLSLFTLLWAASTLIYTYYNTRHMDMSANPAMKYVQYLMPVMFLGFFNNYAAGLTCYMLFSNLINIAQTVITKKFIFTDEKLKAELHRKKSKPKKKNKFQERLEEAMKQQQQMQQQQQKKNK